MHTSPTQAVDQATAVIKPFKDNKVQGQIQFTRIDGGVKVVADLEGLKPGKHGFMCTNLAIVVEKMVQLLDHILILPSSRMLTR